MFRIILAAAVSSCAFAAALTTDFSAQASTMSPAEQAASTTGAYTDGRRDRIAWENWFNGLPVGSYWDGAYYWSGARSRNPPGVCVSPTGDPNWEAGCKEAQHRLAIVDIRRKSEPDYWWGWNSDVSMLPPPVPQPPTSLAPYAPPAPLPNPEAERQRRELEEKGREALRQQRKKDQQKQLTTKLQELGYKLVSPIELALDWQEMRTASTKIAIQGSYQSFNDTEGLLVPFKDEPLIRLFSDNASRDARKAMLECRESDFSPSKCQMIIGGTVQSCVRNKGQINEKEVPCLAVREAFILPDEAILSMRLN